YHGRGSFGSFAFTLSFPSRAPPRRESEALFVSRPPEPDPEDEDDGLDESPSDEGGVRVGDLAVLPVPRVRSQVGCGARVRVVLEDRRNVVKVFFPEIDRAFWVDRRDVLA